MTTVDVRAGLLYTISNNGDSVFGSPDDFVSDSGLSGEGLLSELLRPPCSYHLFYGARREALAEARSVLFFGYQETRAWDSPSQYIADNNEGDVGVIRFYADYCVGVVSGHGSDRTLDAVLISAPEPQRAALRSVCDLPLLRLSEHMPITAMFWNVSEFIESSEPWHEVYRHGAELFRRELLNDDEWILEASTHYDIESDVAALMIAIVRRSADTPVRISPEELIELFPPNAERRAEAIELLARGGVFVVG